MDLSLPFLADATVVIDGRGDDVAWGQAATLPALVPFSPAADADPVGHVEARVFTDARGLWVHMRVTDPAPELVRAGFGRRDTRWDDDQVGVLVDPDGDGRRAYVFGCNAQGGQIDRLHIPGQMGIDPAWDATWSCAGRRTVTGYEVELGIPWAAARMGGALDDFGLLVYRKVPRVGMTSAWPPVDVGTDILLAAADVHAEGRVRRRVGLEVIPEITASYADPPVETTRLQYLGVSPGLTVRWDPGGAVAGVATFNPDYSQLESDSTQIETNARYALYYDEKRPFFLEGQDWFAHPYEDVVYTRTTRAPLYGVRATAEAGPVGFAALHALDMSPPASVNEGGGWTDADLDGHMALATVARGRVSLGGDAYIGLLGSDRTVLGSDLANRVVGVDARVRLEKRAWIDLAALGSATVRTERGDTELAPAGKVALNWSGKHIWARVQADAIAPGFRQENGFWTYEDRFGAIAEAHYNVFPSDWMPKLSLEPVDIRQYVRIDGSLRERVWDPSVWAVFGDGSMIKLDGSFGAEEFAGDVVDYTNGELYVATSLGQVLRLEAGGLTGTTPVYDPADPRAGLLYEGWAWLELQPVSRFTLGLSPFVDDMHEVDGTPLFTVWTARAKAELFVTQQGWVRVVGERAMVGADRWRVEPVAGWEWSPGRAVYLGGSYAEEDAVASWQVFGKVGWAFSI